MSVMTRIWLIILAVAGLGLAGGLPGIAEPTYDYGCLASSGTDLDGYETTRGLGPVYEHSSKDGTNRLFAVRPLFVHEYDASRGKEALDVLWPVSHFSWWHNQTDWRFLTMVYHDPDSADPASPYRFWIMPFIAMGRSKSTGEDYGALFPIGGRIDEWFGRDRVEFVLFPLYWHSELNDLRTDHYLWPFISRTTGDDIYRIRVFPFYIRAEKKGVGEHRAIMWPFWTTVRYDRPGSRGSGYMLFPIYGHSKTEAGETWMFLPPFFRHSTGKAGTQNVYLWPFIQTTKSKGEDKFYVWPLYGRRTTASENRRFWLWPFCWNRTDFKPDRVDNRVSLFPFYHSQKTTLKKPDQPVVDRFVGVWPLGSYERRNDDYKRFRFPDFWTIRNTERVERTVTPLWTLYKYERTAVGRENDVLWGLIHWGTTTNGASYASVFPFAAWGRGDKDGQQKNWEFLKGMVGYRRDESGTNWRLLYFINWRNKP